MLSTMKRTVVGFHIPVFDFVIVKQVTCDETFVRIIIRCTVRTICFAGCWSPNVHHYYLYIFFDVVHFCFPVSKIRAKVWYAVKNYLYIFHLYIFRPRIAICQSHQRIPLRHSTYMGWDGEITRESDRLQPCLSHKCIVTTQ